MKVSPIGRFLLAALVLWYALSFLWGISLDHDEVEHLHCAWLVANGRVPFVDFWQNHSPLVWLVLAPLLRVVPAGGLIAPLARTLTLGLLIASIFTVVRIGRHLHGDRRHDLVTVFLCLGVAGSTQLCSLRPDLFANLLSLMAIGLVLSCSRLFSIALAGVLAGLAVSFDPKHAWVFGVVFVAGLAQDLPRGRWAKVLALWAVGALCGLLPLFAYLVHAGLLHAFVEAVFRANSRSLAGAHFTAIHLSITGVLLCLVALSSLFWRAPSPQTADGRATRKTLAAALALSLAAFLGKPGDLLEYNFQMSALLSVPLAVDKVSALLDRPGPRARPLARLAPLAAAAVFFLLDNGVAYFRGDHPPHFQTRSTFSELVRLAGPGPVVAQAPFHPIFSDDALVLYNGWQWRWRHEPGLREPLRAAADELIAARPTLVQAVWGENATGPELSERTTFPMVLVEEQLISREDGARLLRFFDDGYLLERVSGVPYWVRRDRAGKIPDDRGPGR